MGFPEDLFLHPVDPNLLCTICHDVLQDSVECPRCEDSFCKVCILQYLRNHDGKTCPNCRTRLTENALQVSRKIHSILDNLQARCFNYQSGCKLVTSLEQLEYHKDVCQFKPKTAVKTSADEETSYLKKVVSQLLDDMKETKEQNKQLKKHYEELKGTITELKENYDSQLFAIRMSFEDLLTNSENPNLQKSSSGSSQRKISEPAVGTSVRTPGRDSRAQNSLISELSSRIQSRSVSKDTD